MRTKSTIAAYIQLGFRSVGLWNVELDVPTQRFFYGDTDVTDQVGREWKASFPGYDVERANLEAREAAGRGSSEVGETSTVALFVRGVQNDAARVSGAARDVFGLGKPNVETEEAEPPKDAKPFRTLAVVAVVAVVLFVAWQLGVFALVRNTISKKTA